MLAFVPLIRLVPRHFPPGGKRCGVEKICGVVAQLIANYISNLHKVNFAFPLGRMCRLKATDEGYCKF